MVESRVARMLSKLLPQLSRFPNINISLETDQDPLKMIRKKAIAPDSKELPGTEKITVFKKLEYR